MTRVRRAICRVIGHARTRPLTGRLGVRGAIASVCPRCMAILGVRPAQRAERRRIQFGRP